jgi:NADH-quinone oxidoreductase subunit L
MHHGLHAVHDHDTDPQDIRNMGGLAKKMPVTFVTFLVATLAISGVPLFSAFLSKDEILAGAWAFGGLRGDIAVMIPWIGFIVAAMTAFYMFRVVILTFLGESKRPDIFAHIHESPMTMKVPIIVLAALSIWVFYSMNPFSGPDGWFVKSVQTPVTVTGNYWYQFDHDGGHEAMQESGHETAATHGGEDVAHETAATHVGQQTLAHATHDAHIPAMVTSLVLAFAGIGFAFAMYRRRMIDPDKLAARVKPLHTFLMNKWYFDEIYEKWVVLPALHSVSRAMNWFDTRIVDGAVNGAASLTQLQSRISGLFDKWVVDGAVNLLAYTVGFAGVLLKKTQSGKIQAYIAFVITGVMVLFYVLK